MPRGFAGMSPAKRREIAKKGARALHKSGLAHQWDTKSAKVAGRKGGQNRSKKEKPIDK